MTRKCSFRFLLVEGDGWASAITQDVRRSKNIITGHISMFVGSRDAQHFAKEYGCSVIIRKKESL